MIRIWILPHDEFAERKQAHEPIDNVILVENSQPDEAVAGGRVTMVHHHRNGPLPGPSKSRGSAGHGQVEPGHNEVRLGVIPRPERDRVDSVCRGRLLIRRRRPPWHRFDHEPKKLTNTQLVVSQQRILLMCLDRVNATAGNQSALDDFDEFFK